MLSIRIFFLNVYTAFSETNSLPTRIQLKTICTIGMYCHKPTPHHLTVKKRAKSETVEPTWLRPVNQSRCFPPNEKKNEGKRKEKSGDALVKQEKKRRACACAATRFIFWLAADVTGSSTQCRSLSHPIQHMQPRAQRVIGAPRTNCTSTFRFSCPVVCCFCFCHVMS